MTDQGMDYAQRRLRVWGTKHPYGHLFKLKSTYRLCIHALVHTLVLCLHESYSYTPCVHTQHMYIHTHPQTSGDRMGPGHYPRLLSPAQRTRKLHCGKVAFYMWPTFSFYRSGNEAPDRVRCFLPPCSVLCGCYFPWWQMARACPRTLTAPRYP